MTRPTPLLVSFAVMMITACGGSSTSPSPTNVHVELTDPIGDVTRDPFGPVPPDLVRGAVDVSGGNITFTVTFAPGTFDAQTTWLFIELDTDQNPLTGVPTGGLGMDYFVSMSGTPGTAIVYRCPSRSALCSDAVGMPTVSLMSDGVGIAMPLSFFGLLGDDQGKRDFRIYSSPFGGFGPDDYMPDRTLPPAHVP
jgi:hypothetical protein